MIAKTCALCTEYFVPQNHRGRPPVLCAKCKKLRRQAQESARQQYARLLCQKLDEFIIDLGEYGIVEESKCQKKESKKEKKMLNKPLL